LPKQIQHLIDLDIVTADDILGGEALVFSALDGCKY